MSTDIKFIEQKQEHGKVGTCILNTYTLQITVLLLKEKIDIQISSNFNIMELI